MAIYTASEEAGKCKRRELGSSFLLSIVYSYFLDLLLLFHIFGDRCLIFDFGGGRV